MRKVMGVVGTGPSSSESVISAEALYFIFGFGPAGQASPWTGTGVLQRQPSAHATRLLASAIGVPADAFFAWQSSVATPITFVSNYSDSPEKNNQALAYVTSPTADTGRSLVKALAYQHFGQTCGVWPDSTPEAFDKRNVRNGKYALWRAGSFVGRVDAQGELVNARVANFFGWFDGRAALSARR